MLVPSVNCNSKDPTPSDVNIEISNESPNRSELYGTRWNGEIILRNATVQSARNYVDNSSACARGRFNTPILVVKMFTTIFTRVRSCSHLSPFWKKKELLFRWACNEIVMVNPPNEFYCESLSPRPDDASTLDRSDVNEF